MEAFMARIFRRIGLAALAFALTGCVSQDQYSALKLEIDRFARILNSPGASQYELLVAGHTDSAPVHNPVTIQNGHKDNWYLSSHRAITVGSEMIKTGVNAARLGVVGYADQHPIASNSS